MSLQTGVKIIAVLAILGSIVNIVVVSIAFPEFEKAVNNGTTTDGNDDDNNRGVVVGVFAVFIIAMVVDLIISIFLWFGAVHRNPSYCLGWLIVAVIVLCITIFQVISGEPVAIVTFILRFYFFWVVFAFRREIKDELAMGTGYGYGGRTIPQPNNEGGGGNPGF